MRRLTFSGPAPSVPPKAIASGSAIRGEGGLNFWLTGRLLWGKRFRQHIPNGIGVLLKVCLPALCFRETAGSQSGRNEERKIGARQHELLHLPGEPPHPVYLNTRSGGKGSCWSDSLGPIAQDHRLSKEPGHFILVRVGSRHPAYSPQLPPNGMHCSCCEPSTEETGTQEKPAMHWPSSPHGMPQ